MFIAGQYLHKSDPRVAIIKIERGREFKSHLAGSFETFILICVL